MGLLIDRINVRERAKYEQNTIKVLKNVVKPITTREYLVPNNAKSSAVYFWQNVLLIPPVRDRHTFPLTFIPTDNKDIIVKARFSHHPSGPLDNWTKYEAMGSPNKRVDIYFFGADDSDDPNGDVEAHVINNRHLYSDSDVKLLQQALANFLKSGNFVNPFCENIENNNIEQINCNTNMNKKLIRLTESDLHRIVKESVNRILNEIGERPWQDTEGYRKWTKSDLDEFMRGDVNAANYGRGKVYTHFREVLEYSFNSNKKILFIKPTEEFENTDALHGFYDYHNEKYEVIYHEFPNGNTNCVIVKIPMGLQ